MEKIIGIAITLFGFLVGVLLMCVITSVIVDWETVNTSVKVLFLGACFTCLYGMVRLVNFFHKLEGKL